MSPYLHIPFNELNPSQLAEFIVGRYHAVLKGLSSLISAQLRSIKAADSSMALEVQAIGGLFWRLHEDLSSHLRKEEFVLFPYVRQAVERAGAKPQPVPLLPSVLQQMRRDHRQFTETMAQIRRLSNNYTAARTAGVDLRLCLASLQEFESELQEHIYLENNILFPKLLNLEECAPEQEATGADA